MLGFDTTTFIHRYLSIIGFFWIAQLDNRSRIYTLTTPGILFGGELSIIMYTYPPIEFEVDSFATLVTSNPTLLLPLQG